MRIKPKTKLAFRYGNIGAVGLIKRSVFAVEKHTLSVYYSCDLTSIRLRFDYDESNQAESKSY